MLFGFISPRAVHSQSITSYKSSASITLIMWASTSHAWHITTQVSDEYKGQKGYLRQFSDASSNLVYATTHSVITILDLRTTHVLQIMENPRHYGPITCLCLDRKRSWIVVGTSAGVLTLWDRRFGLLLKSWHVGIASTGRSARIHQCVVHPSKGRGKWVMVTVEASKRSVDRTSTTLVEVWDIENAVLVETFVTRTAAPSEPIQVPHEVSGVDADANPATAIAALVRSRQVGGDSTDNHSRPSSRSTKDELLPAPAPNVRAIVVGLDFGGHSLLHRSGMSELTTDSSLSVRTAGRGFMVSGSDDRKIRLWDMGRLERTAVLSGLESEHERPSYRCIHETNHPLYNT